MYSVAVYEVTLCYGGPEEGGWWYTSGYPNEYFERFDKKFKSERSAVEYKRRLERHLISRLNKGKAPLSSVLSDGRYEARLEEGRPKAFPLERPHYE